MKHLIKTVAVLTALAGMSGVAPLAAIASSTPPQPASVFQTRPDPGTGGTQATLSSMAVDSHGNGTLTVKLKSGGTVAIVTVSNSTKYYRHFWEKDTLSEYSVGDTLFIFGTKTNKTVYQASSIRNASIWMGGVVAGDGIITSINTYSKTILIAETWENHRTVTIRYDANTHFVKENGTVVKDSQLAIGQHIAAEGLLRAGVDKQSNIDRATRVKILSK